MNRFKVHTRLMLCMDSSPNSSLLTEAPNSVTPGKEFFLKKEIVPFTCSSMRT